MKFSVIASIAGSLLLGVAALVVARFWLPANQDAAPTVAAPPQVDTSLKPIVVASAALAYGARLEEGKLAVRHVPADAAPDGAFASIEEVLAHDATAGAPLVLTPIAQREAILPSKISGPGSRPSVATQITEGMRAYAVGVSDESGVGGNVLPGDWVDVVLSRETNDERKDRGLVSEVVLQNVRVLGLDLNADPTSTETSVPNTATLEVKLEDVQKLAVATQLGRLSLALRRTGASELAKVRPVRAGEVSIAGVSAPAPRAPVVRASAPAAPTGRSIMIVAGGQPNRVQVPADRGAGR